MDIEIYCDESRHELFSNKKETPGKYVLIGGVWIEASKRQLYKENIKKLRSEEKVFSEVKWKNVSPSKIGFYLKFIDLFFQSEMRFRCVVIEKDKLNLVKYHQSDQELGFYKFYYQLLHHWILDFNKYSIFTDLKTNRTKNRLQELQNVLRCSNLTSQITQIQAINSKESQFIQLADLFIGAIGYKFHDHTASLAKLQVIKQIEKRLEDEILPTTKCEPKFNIFKIQLEGNW